jgi:hypothetical protein
MKYTQENITELLTNFGKLQDEVNKFVNRERDSRKYTWSQARINYETFAIERKENTACNCHPEYEWVEFSTMHDFLEWYEKQQVTENSTKA